MNLSELVESLGATEFKARLVAELDSLVEQNPDFVYITQDQLAELAKKMKEIRDDV